MNDLSKTYLLTAVEYQLHVYHTELRVVLQLQTIARGLAGCKRQPEVAQTRQTDSPFSFPLPLPFHAAPETTACKTAAAPLPRRRAPAALTRVGRRAVSGSVRAA